MATMITQTCLSITITHSVPGLLKLTCLYKFHMKTMSYI